MKLAVGDVVGDDEVIAVLGRGGTGEVYHVRHRETGDDAALKVLHNADDQMVTRLRREARILAELSHPHIVHVHALVELPELIALRMDRVDGDTLRRWMDDHPDPSGRRARALTLFRAMLGAIAFAHDKGVVHRDLKPENVLVDDDDLPHVLDFGIALLSRAGVARVTLAESRLGTPAYTAPEQHEDPRLVDRRADVFSLGCMLYELVLGVPPFKGEPVPVMMRIMAGKYTRPAAVDPTLDASLARAIDGALDPDLEARIPDCATLEAVLDGAPWPADAEEAPAPPTPYPSDPAPSAGLGWAVVALGLVGLATWFALG